MRLSEFESLSRYFGRVSGIWSTDLTANQATSNRHGGSSPLSSAFNALVVEFGRRGRLKPGYPSGYHGSNPCRGTHRDV